jgi:hypothetical protein
VRMVIEFEQEAASKRNAIRRRLAGPQHCPALSHQAQFDGSLFHRCDTTHDQQAMSSGAASWFSQLLQRKTKASNIRLSANVTSRLLV